MIPGFSQEAFLEEVQRTFFIVQEAWTQRQPGLSRQVMADGLWQQHRVQIQGYVDAHKRNVLEDLAVGDLTIIAAHHDTSYDTITVRVLAACADYDVDDEQRSGHPRRQARRPVDGGLDLPAVGVGHHAARRWHPRGQVPQLRGAPRPRPGGNLQVLQGAGQFGQLRLGAGPDRPGAGLLLTDGRAGPSTWRAGRRSNRRGGWRGAVPAVHGAPGLALKRGGAVLAVRGTPARGPAPTDFGIFYSL